MLAGAAIAAAVVWAAARDGTDASSNVVAVDVGPVHVHGLGINPADGALFIATHTGMWRVAQGAVRARRVGTSHQDTMGFTVAAPNYFLGSGHPDLDEAQERGLPPHLGLIESRDAGKTWRPVSLLGEADFHVLRAAGRRIYGYDASNDRLLVSTDRGRSWREVTRPAPVLDLAVAPDAPQRVVAATEAGVFASDSGGRAWRRVSDEIGLLAWPSATELILVTGDGSVAASSDGGRRWIERGNIGGPPAALLAASPGDLYAALHDGTVKRSRDGGRTWTVRSRP